MFTTDDIQASQTHAQQTQALGASVRERGVAMLVVLIAVAIATILSMSFLSSQATSLGVSQNVQGHAQARSVAESALVAAINYVQTDADWRTDKADGQWVASASFNGGTFDLYGYDGLDTDGDGVVDDTDGDLSDDSSDPVTLKVVADVDGVSHTVFAVVTTGETEGVDGNLLFVVNNDSSLNSYEIKRQTFFESLGWTVVLIEDSDSQATYDAALVDASVVYVSESVNSHSVNSKLKSATVGVVDEERLLHDDFEFASSGASTHTMQTIDIVDNSHYITSPFSLGALTVTSTPIVLTRNNSTVSAGAQVLATNSSPTLFVFDAGDLLEDGSAAAARRVALFIGDTNLDFDDLTDDGKTIVERSLLWASAEVSMSLPLARWALEETSGSTAVDSMGLSNGTYRNNPSLGQAGNSGFATRFDGSNDFIEIAHDDAMLLDNGTISFWFKADNTSGHQAMFSKDSSDYDTGGHCHIYLDGSTLKVRFQSTSTSYTVQESGISSGTWYHVAFTFGSSGIKLYLDGVEVDTDSYTGGMGTTSGGIGNYEPLAIGGGTWNSGNLSISTTNYFYDGLIDDVRIYGSALSGSQVNQIYSGASSEATTDPQLIALYEFEEVVPPVPALVGHWPLDDAAPASGTVEFGVAMGYRLRMYSSTLIDGYSSSAGAYGGANSGLATVVSTDTTLNNTVYFYGTSRLEGDFSVGPGGDPSSMITSYSSVGITGTTGVLASEVGFPSLSAPSGMPANEGNTTYNGGAIAINTDRTFQDLTLNSGAVITVTGDVRINVRDDLTLNSSSQIVVTPGSRLELYVADRVTLSSSSSLNPLTSNPAGLTLIMYGANSDMTLNTNTSICGVVYVGDDLTMNSGSAIYGAVLVDDELTMNGTSAIHVDTDIVGGGLVVIDDADANNGAESGGVTAGVVGHGDGGTAMAFDGSDDFIEIAHSDDYLLNEGSLAFWFKADSLSGIQGLVTKDSTNFDTGGHIRVYTEGSTLKARIQSTTTSYYVQSSGLSTGNWYHVTVSWGAGGLRLFRDGAERDTDSYTGGLGTNSGGAGNYEPIVVGADTWKSGDLDTSGLQDYFDGTIDEVRIYDQGLNESQVGEVYASGAPSPGVATTVYDTSEYGTALDLDIEETGKVSWVPGGGLTLDSATRISSADAASKLYTALTATDEMSVEVIFTPANTTQSGPARIVSYSGGSSARNFTFGQDGDEYVTRLRTSSTTSNGTPNAESGATLATGVEEHVIVSYDGENITMYRDGGSAVTLARTGTFNWTSSYRFMFGNEIDGGRDWLGTLSRVAVYDRAFNENQANNVFGGSEPGDGTSGAGVNSVDWVER